MLRQLALRLGAALSLAPLTHCVLCHASCTRTHGICSPCRAELPRLGHSCTHCALPLANPVDTLCARCQQHPPPFAASHTCWYYAYPVAQLIQRFKFQQDLAAGRTLADVAAAELQPSTARPDVLVPIPMHWWRQFARGYNQADLIAQTFAARWQIPLAPHLLRKSTPTGKQSQLKRRARLQNLSGSFCAHPQVKGLHVGLVDDVITTGATLEAAAATLLTAGAQHVSTYALARTP